LLFAGTVPAKLLLQLATLFESTGLSDRSRTFFYKEHIHRTNVPILALAGDQDLICPPEAVYGMTLSARAQNYMLYLLVDLFFYFFGDLVF